MKVARHHKGGTRLGSGRVAIYNRSNRTTNETTIEQLIVNPHRAAARMSELAPGQLLPVQVDGIEMIVYRLGARVYAAQRRCLHQGADLADGMILRGSIVCAQHGWRFDAETGVHEMSSENCLVTYRAWVEGDEIMIDTTPIRRAEVPR